VRVGSMEDSFRRNPWHWRPRHASLSATPRSATDAAAVTVCVGDPPERVPLAVWPCAQTSAQYQRAGRYLPGSSSHPGKMLPELAHRLVAEYCPPGGLVADPMCGIGTTLVEAATLHRRAVGVELETRWVQLAHANLTNALPAEQAALAEVRHGDARRLPDVLEDVAGRVDLVVTSPPYACDAGVIDKPAWRAGHPMCPRDTLNYSRCPQPGWDWPPTWSQFGRSPAVSEPSTTLLQGR
jgi:DNA methylase